MYDILNNCDYKVVKQHAQRILESLDYIDSNIYKSFFNVGIVRRNMFDAALSYTIASITNEWDDYTYTRNDVLTIDVEQFIESIDIQFDNLAAFYKLKNMNMFDKIVYYEDLTFIPQIDIDKYCTYTNSKCTKYFESIVTVCAPDKKKIVINYEQLYNISLDYFKTKIDYETKLYIDGVTHKVYSTNNI